MSFRDSGTSIVLTTHYINEAEEIADRVGIISDGKISVVEEKHTLMKKFGSKRRLEIGLDTPLDKIPSALSEFQLLLEEDGEKLVLIYESNSSITDLLNVLRDNDISYKNINIKQMSLEEVFIKLTRDS